jgi:alpha,alpha-trehalase
MNYFNRYIAIFSPAFLKRIDNKDYREFANDLHNLWKVLGRRVKDRVRDYAERHSLYYVPYPTIVPGGRFREFYYW